MQRYTRILIELLPLQILALSFFLVKTSQPDGWMIPYYISAVAAMCCMGILVKKQVTPDAAIWGINIYLMVSGLLLWAGTQGFAALLLDMRGSGLLGSVFFVSLVAFGTRPQWLLSMDEDSPDNLSFIQLIITGVCFCLSFAFRDNSIAASMLPLLFVFAGKKILQDTVRDFQASI